MSDVIQVSGSETLTIQIGTSTLFQFDSKWVIGLLPIFGTFLPNSDGTYTYTIVKSSTWDEIVFRKPDQNVVTVSIVLIPPPHLAESSSSARMDV